MKTVLPHADFVIEGYVDPREPLRDEGPFGDHTGYYILPEPYPVFHVTAITCLRACCASGAAVFCGHENIDGRGSGGWLGPMGGTSAGG